MPSVTTYLQGMDNGKTNYEIKCIATIYVSGIEMCEIRTAELASTDLLELGEAARAAAILYAEDEIDDGDDDMHRCRVTLALTLPDGSDRHEGPFGVRYWLDEDGFGDAEVEIDGPEWSVQR